MMQIFKIFLSALEEHNNCLFQQKCKILQQLRMLAQSFGLQGGEHPRPFRLARRIFNPNHQPWQNPVIGSITGGKS